MIRGLLASFFLVALVGCGASTPAAVPPSKTQAPAPTATPAPVTHVRATFATWRLPYAIAREAAIADPGHPGQVVLAGGMFPGDTSSARAVLIDLTTGRSQPLPSLGTQVHDVAGGLYAGNPAVFGGGNASEQSVVQALTGGRWKPVTHLPTTRSDLSVVSVAGTTLVIGGYDGTNVPRDILAVEPHGLRTVGQLKTGVRYAATAVVGSSVFVFGGEVNGRELNTVQVYNAAKGRSAVEGRLPRPLGHAVAVRVGSRVLLLGGRTDPNTQTAAMWWFDPSTGRFSRAGSLPAALSDSAVVAIGGQVWLLGGEDPSVTDRVVAIRVS
ncbi:MAG: Kelch repeat-containing protein [Marmoricola sp.]|nr:Kelch repeat-containing protein [Marmoricola sp.]